MAIIQNIHRDETSHSLPMWVLNISVALVYYYFVNWIVHFKVSYDKQKLFSKGLLREIRIDRTQVQSITRGRLIFVIVGWVFIMNISYWDPKSKKLKTIKFLSPFTKKKGDVPNIKEIEEIPIKSKKWT